MFRDKKRFGQDPSVVVRSSAATFEAPLRWREPRRIFTCSWSDFFIDKADAWRPEAWEIIRETPQHTYQILTRRPERIREHLPWKRAAWANVWLLIPAEDQPNFDRRWKELERIPAALRGVSAEPLLGPIDLRRVARSGRLGWVIGGGESGPRARPMEADWVRSLRDQCAEFGVPFFFKQWGGVFKNRNGRSLDDATWSAFPESSPTQPLATRNSARPARRGESVVHL